MLLFFKKKPFFFSLLVLWNILNMATLIILKEVMDDKTTLFCHSAFGADHP